MRLNPRGASLCSAVLELFSFSLLFSEIAGKHICMGRSHTASILLDGTVFAACLTVI